MLAFVTLMRRELAGFFVSLSGYVIIASVALLVGLSYWSLAEALRGEAVPVPLTELFFNTTYFWIILLLSTPVITMRLFALEKYSGTFETLMTAPVSDLTVVMAKFAAALVFFLLMWLPLLGYIALLQHYSSGWAMLVWGGVGGAFAGIFLIGCLFMAIGAFASSLTRNQIIAAVISLLLGVALVFMGFLGKAVTPREGLASDVLRYVSMFDHMEDFSRGILDTRAVAFYLSSTLFFLFFTHRIVESRRWK